MSSLLEAEQAALAVEVSHWEASGSEKGQIYTRPEVVEYMLTAIGLDVCANDSSVTVLEPSCGHGEFTTEIIRRLITLPVVKPTTEELVGKLFAIDLVGESVKTAKSRAHEILLDHGYSEDDSKTLTDSWFHVGDFLLADIPRKFRFVVGNPPYVRVENIPKVLLAEYRRRFTTMTDRADLYVPFYERALSLLEENGKLSFICTDRWTKNTYGRSLRKLIHAKYSLELYVDLYGIEAFASNVMTYPAITQISNTSSDLTVLLHKTNFSQSEASKIAKSLSGADSDIILRKGVVDDSKPWLLGAADEISLIRRLEKKFPSLESAGCKVYIGAATGANKIYVINKASVDIESARLLPVITASEIKSGKINWAGRYLINTYDQVGLVDLKDYPKMAAYLTSHKAKLSSRHVAVSDKSRWYKTIDRVYENRCRLPKLMIPDISSDLVAVYDEGKFHPNNSIYYICSQEWDLHALKVVMLSRLSSLFVKTYSTKIANGYLRFQAQVLRKICLPQWSGLDSSLRDELILAGKTDAVSEYDRLVFMAYGLDEHEMEIVGF
ncbi:MULTISPECIES: Eco57I restriction-modification methylase domain-containing protein [Pseudomonas syringae group]|uniref:Eco57I restriction-modification methylase domain-containing protein n=1 Tax=Pseudomonas syringae group TaxID=136849 RepID=UPI000414177A|nr:MULTISPECIES: TaqI-like C-terminal specificity domain-containing protein [Pseudomonas syringae group]QQN27782.1 Eco57I restriction-modification methylase domain-containing protein [Pseudomonas syringae pv. maculicola]